MARPRVFLTAEMKRRMAVRDLSRQLDELDRLRAQPGEIIGYAVDGLPSDEQKVDMRDLGQVLHHEEPVHAPIDRNL
jgi:hypothetical protein